LITVAAIKRRRRLYGQLVSPFSMRISLHDFALIELHLLNFSCSNCRNQSHGVSYNAQDSKVYMSEGDVRLPFSYRQNPPGNNANNAWAFGSYGATRYTVRDGCSSNEETTFLCHGNHGQQCADANTGLAGLALALTVHAILEGLAIGLQTEIAEVREYDFCDL